MIGHNVNMGEGVKGDSRQQTQGIIKASHVLLTLISQVRSELTNGYKNAPFPSRTPPYSDPRSSTFPANSIRHTHSLLSTLSTRITIATLNNTTSPTPLIPTQVSVLDFIIPGSTGILAAIEPVLAINNSARPLLLCILLVFLGRHVCRYIWRAAETHFGPSPCQVEDAF